MIKQPCLHVLRKNPLPKRSHFTDEQRGMIIAYRKLGKTLGEIVKLMGDIGVTIKRSSVQMIVQRFNTRKTVSRKKGSGRKFITNERDNRRLKNEALANRKQSLSQLAKTFTTLEGEKISRFTVSRRLKDQGLSVHACRRVPMLSKANIKKRKIWVKKHLNEPLAYWDNVIWSDESRFCLVNDGKQKCLRRKGEAYRSDCTTRTVKFPDGVMVWGCFSRNGVGHLYRMPEKTTIDSAVYQKILADYLIPSIDELHPDKNYIFMQDGAKCHTSKSTIAWLKENRINFMPDWPPQSPDLNPIENIWAYINAKLRDHHFTNKEQLWQRLKIIWNEIPQGLIDKLITSVPSRLSAVVKSKGGSIPY